MKSITLILSVLGFTILLGCSNKTDVNALLENKTTRTEIITAVKGNHDYMTDFTEAMQNNDHAMQMMQGSPEMMGNMMKGQGMPMMMKDSTMMNSMMEHMLKDGRMMGHMMQMMHEKGMMNDDCMQSCMNMMKEKGMDMEGIGMINAKEQMESDVDSNFKQHH